MDEENKIFYLSFYEFTFHVFINKFMSYHNGVLLPLIKHWQIPLIYDQLNLKIKFTILVKFDDVSIQYTTQLLSAH